MEYISEKDLYMFLFYPENLSEEKKSFIELNSKKFETEIELLRNMKKNLEAFDSDSVIGDIYEKIDNQISSDVIILEKKEM